MTNEEKAKELAFESPQCQMYIDNKCTQNFPCDRFKVALKMAQWKDEQFEEEKKEIDEQWKRLMEESKSIGVDLLQRKDEQHAKEKQQWIMKVCKWLKEHYGIFASTIPFWWSDFLDMLKQDMEKKL